MIIGFQQVQIQQWKNQLNLYQTTKRGNPTPNKLDIENKRVVRQTFTDHSVQLLRNDKSLQLGASRTKQSQNKVDSSLAKYLKFKYKEDREFDIITSQALSQSMFETLEQRKRKNMEPIRNLYNIINGQKIKDELVKNRILKLPSAYVQRKFENNRDYNIINLKYHKNDKQKVQNQEQKTKKQIIKNIQKDHVFDKIYQRFYDPVLEEKYWKDKKKQEIDLASSSFHHNLEPLRDIKLKYKEQIQKQLQKERPAKVIKMKDPMRDSIRNGTMKGRKKQQYVTKQRLIKQKMNYQKVVNNTNRINEKKTEVVIKKGGFQIQ